MAKSTPALWMNLVASGLYFYGYNELATMTLKKTNAVTQSVANTAKRVIVIVGVALVLGESLSPIKLIGCSIGIGGVFLYSIIDNIIKPKD
jgi:solute carrier family 35 protein E1